MNRFFSLIMSVLLLASTSPSSAQLLNKEAPVIVGHYHLNVTSVDEHKKFWVDTLGGTAMKFGRTIDVIKFPDILLFLRVQKPTGGHARHRVRSHRLRRAGRAGDDHQGRRQRLPADRRPRARAGPGGRRRPTAGSYGQIRLPLGPDGVKVELVTTANRTPRRSRTITCTSSTSNTSRCSSGT